MKLRRRSRSRPARIEMVPLIDIVFLLLVFFIYAMLSMAVHRGMDLNLPESARSVRSPEQGVSVSVLLENGAVRLFLDREPVEPAEFEERLRRWKDGQEVDAEVLLFADKTVSYQQLYQVLDRINAAGITSISLQAEPRR